MSYASMLKIFLAAWAFTCPGNANSTTSIVKQIRHDAMGFAFGIGSDSPSVRDPARKDFSPRPSMIGGDVNTLD
jgi:hypothetical protein